MKTTTYLPVLAVFAGVLLSSSALHGEDKAEKKKTPKKSEEAMSKKTIEALEKSGLDPEMIEKIKETMKKGGNSSVAVSTTVVGPDGNVITSTQRSENGVVVDVTGEGTRKMTLDLGKLISEAATAAGGAKAEAQSSADSSVSPSISGKVVVVDENGKVHSQSMGASIDTEALQKALGEALGSIDIKMNGLEGLFQQNEVFGFGPATIEGGDVSERLDKIEKELKEQREILQKILKKL